MNAELHAGDEAPDFRAASVENGKDCGEFHLAALRGQRVILCFYPADDVPAATRQLDGLRAAWGAIRGKAALFGVSRETVENLRRVVEHLGLPFPLLTDADNAIARQYGIWLGEGGGGDVEGGSLTERSTFVISGDGRIEAILRDVKADEHAEVVLRVLN